VLYLTGAASPVSRDSMSKPAATVGELIVRQLSEGNDEAVSMPHMRAAA
jgi:hypothetical protein